MVYNRSGYHGRFTPQQMHIIAKQEQSKNNAKEKQAMIWNKKQKFYSDLEVIINKYSLDSYLDIDHSWLNRIHIPEAENDEQAYYIALDKYPDLCEFIDKSGVLGESIKFVK
ncbi:hypothetical protein [Paenibacillus alkalitolerans]|uniref:hypothetical protein n=1 Tax=Paenibacillus alkalitolerans TaxID=2799335 RepID=UPI0018F7AA2E|nr:hypothetical protein [Paenibacillus alkalitolerans]